MSPTASCPPSRRCPPPFRPPPRPRPRSPRYSRQAPDPPRRHRPGAPPPLAAATLWCGCGVVVATCTKRRGVVAATCTQGCLRCHNHTNRTETYGSECIGGVGGAHRGTAGELGDGGGVAAGQAEQGEGEGH